MSLKKLYKEISSNYNQRYSNNEMQGVEDFLQFHCNSDSVNSILEIGCGTGYWVSKFAKKEIYGIDLSVDMIKQAGIKNSSVANAIQIPFKSDYFDFIFLVNVFHHIKEKTLLFEECKRLLSSKGKITIVTPDPRTEGDEWYLYDHFEDRYDFDLNRFLSVDEIKKIMEEAGLKVTIEKIELVEKTKTGDEVLKDPFLVKNQCSQLASLSYEGYKKGMNSIKDKIKQNSNAEFLVKISYYAITGSIN